MMNLVALCLVLSTIVSGGIFSPPPSQEKKNTNLHREDLIVKEANRVIMVEYEREARPKEDTNNYSPPTEQEPSILEKKLSAEKSMAYGVIDGTKKKMKEAASVLPNLGQGLSNSNTGLNEEEEGKHHYNPKEIICDAYGKCKHKIAGVFGKGKDGVSEKFQEVEEVGERGMEKTKGNLGKAKERAFEKVREMEEAMEAAGEKAMDKTKEGLSKGKETGEMAMEKTKEGTGKVKESVAEKARDLKEEGKETGEKTMENVKNIGQDLKKAHASIWDDRPINAKWTGFINEGTRNLSRIFQRGRHVLIDAAKHSVSKQVMNPTMGVLHLLGLASAYGISVWVTFASSHVLAGALPQQQFGVVQSKIYPVYFQALVGSIGAALLAHILRNPHWGFDSLRTYNMLLSLGIVLLNLLYLEPRASKVMFDKMKLEKEEGRGMAGGGEEFVESTATISTTAATTTETHTEVSGVPSARTGGDSGGEEVRSRVGELNRELKNLNSLSSLLNVLTLMALTWQLVSLGRGLPVS